MKVGSWLLLVLLMTGLVGGCSGGEVVEEDGQEEETNGESGEENQNQAPGATTVTLTHPGDGIFGLSRNVDLVWSLTHFGDRYDIDVARDEGFTDPLVRERNWAGLDYPLRGLEENQTYFWRVRIHGESGPEAWSESRSFSTWKASTRRPVVYQLIVRHFGNTDGANVIDGSLEENGSGRFADIDEVALQRLRAMGVTHVYLTGVLQQATLTDYSEIGEPADDPDILKGRAGSFFAVKDYFDVSPDYAVEPENRREEFRELVDRIHAAGMKALIDLVPNHVARSYGSTVRPDLDLGLNDDQSQFFLPTNNFFYLEQGIPLLLPTVDSHWQAEGMDGLFEPEDGSPGRTARVTGNNIASHQPSVNDWYETVKLNYGLNFMTGETFFDPIPATWEFMREVIRYWMGEFGVDGFRADFAHFVPDEAWKWIIDRTREEFPEAYFIAEAYERLEGLVAAGFDLVYDDYMYDGLKGVYNGTETKYSLDGYFASVSDEMRGRYIRYLENHDEKRIASPIQFDTYPGNSGFGDAQAARHVAPIAYLFGPGAIMIYNGQTVGEEGAGVSGFSGDDGRSTIFDYWRVPALADWVNDGKFDGGGLEEWQLELHEYYRRLIHFTDHPLAMAPGYYGVDFFNRGQEGYHEGLYAFARYEPGGGKLMVVVTNWALEEVQGRIRLPEDLARDLAGLGSQVEVHLVFDETGENRARLNSERTRQSLTSEGFSVRIPSGASRVYVLK